MKNLHLAVVSVLFLAFITSCMVQSPNEWEAKFQNVVDSIYRENPNAVGIMIHVESPENDISFSYAKGFSNKIDSTVIEPDQPMLIASCTKTYVSAAILRLVEEGKLSIEDPIINLINEKTKDTLLLDSYDLNTIKVKHLMSHTSGINDYPNSEFYTFCYENPNHRWSRDEQIAYMVSNAEPVGYPEEKYAYSDVNYLLLSEILENIYKADYNVAISELINYSKLGLNQTWFPTIDPEPENTKSLVHQYYSKHDWDSYRINISYDLYGGGGIASTTKELALFNYYLHNDHVIKDTNTFRQIFTRIPTTDSIQTKYYLGIREYDFSGNKGFGHDGFWGSAAFYFPDKNTSIAVVVLDFDRYDLRSEVIENLVIQLKD